MSFRIWALIILAILAGGAMFAVIFLDRMGEREMNGIITNSTEAFNSTDLDKDLCSDSENIVEFSNDSWKCTNDSRCQEDTCAHPKNTNSSHTLNCSMDEIMDKIRFTWISEMIKFVLGCLLVALVAADTYCNYDLVGDEILVEAVPIGDYQTSGNDAASTLTTLTTSSWRGSQLEARHQFLLQKRFQANRQRLLFL
ncbi:unnamed protein product, partial [Mesorhabditis belari]|uniref:Uncharacterized protein n=1 Tax=Mesorhabditis belari TaxID=2138241 RepID=A0AAF3JB73_9BILA